MSKVESALGKLQSMDIYGMPIGLYYKGSPTYQTKLGGIFTLLTYIFVLAYSVASFVSIVQRDYQIQKSTKTSNEFIDNSMYAVRRKQFDFMYYLNYDYDFNEDPYWNLHRYLFVLPYKVYMTDNYYIVEKYAQEDCVNHDFDKSLEFSDYLGIDYFTCFAEDYFLFQGTPFTYDQHYHVVNFYPCTQELLDQYGYEGETCAEQELIDHLIDNSFLSLYFLTQTFQEADFDAPFVTVPKGFDFYFKRDQGFTQQILLKKNEVLRKDSWLQEGLSKEDNIFYEVQLGQVQLSTINEQSPAIFRLQIQRSFEEVYITRVASNIIGVLSDIGGIISIVQVSCGIILGSYVESKYYDSILKALFKQQQDLITKPQKKSFTIESQQLKGSQEHLHRRLLSSIVNRQPAKIDPFEGYFRLCSRKKRAREEFQKSQIEEQIQNQFSIDNLIKRIRESQVVSFLTLSKSQRTLLPYVYSNLILTKPETLEQINNQSLLKAKNSTQTLKRKSTSFSAYQEIKGELQQDINNADTVQSLNQSLEEVIMNFKHDKVSYSLIKQLLNFEESDFLEQKILLDNIENEQSKLVSFQGNSGGNTQLSGFNMREEEIKSECESKEMEDRLAIQQKYSSPDMKLLVSKHGDLETKIN